MPLEVTDPACTEPSMMPKLLFQVTNGEPKRRAIYVFNNF